MSQSSIMPSKMVFHLYIHFRERASVSLSMFSAKQRKHRLHITLPYANNVYHICYAPQRGELTVAALSIRPSVRPVCPGRILEGTKGIAMSYLTITIFYISDACPGHILESTKGIEVKLGL